MADGTPKKSKWKRGKTRGRKAWRKSDIGEVEEYLKDRQYDHLTGGPIHEKINAQLYQVDVTPVSGDGPMFIKEESLDNLPDIAKLYLTSQKETETWKDLRCFRSLTGNRTASLEGKPHHNEAANQITRNIRQIGKKVQRTKTLKSAKARRAVEPVEKLGRDPVFNRDLWATETNKDSFVVPDANRAPSQLPPTLRHKKLSSVAHVDIPHPGTSYNPKPEDHEELLTLAADNAVKKALETQKLAAFSKTKALGDKTAAEVWMEEMDQGLQTSGKNAHDDLKQEAGQNDSEDMVMDVSSATPRERKTKQEKKQKERLQQEAKKRLLMKVKKLRDTKVLYTKSILKSIRKREVELAERKAKREQVLNDPKRIRRLGKQKFEEADVDVKLKDDMTDNMRTLQPEGNLIVDRYKNLQKRNILEPRRRQKVKRKYKLKKYQIEGRKVDNVA